MFQKYFRCVPQISFRLAHILFTFSFDSIGAEIVVYLKSCSRRPDFLKIPKSGQKTQNWKCPKSQKSGHFFPVFGPRPKKLNTPFFKHNFVPVSEILSLCTSNRLRRGAKFTSHFPSRDLGRFRYTTRNMFGALGITGWGIQIPNPVRLGRLIFGGPGDAFSGTPVAHLPKFR